MTLRTIKGRTFVFVSLERIDGIMVYDITNPCDPKFIQYINNRDFAVDPEDGTANGTVGDLGPEGLAFIPKEKSPIDAPLLVVTNEVSGSTMAYKIDIVWD